MSAPRKKRKKMRGMRVSPQLAARFGIRIHPAVPSADSERYVSPAQASRALGMTSSAVTRWIHRRRLPAFRLGNGQWRIKLADLAAYMRGRRGNRRHRILLFDHLGTRCPEVAKRLEGQGHLTDLAQSVADALLKALYGIPALIVVNASGKEGWRLVGKIRGTPGLGRTPILILSETPLSPAQQRRARQARAQGVLEGPAAAQVIVAGIERALAQRL